MTSSSRRSSGRAALAVSPRIPRRVIRVERFLRRPERLRHVLEVQADARPCVEPTAHRIDQHIRRLEMGGGLWMALAPALQTCECVVLLLRASDLDQRVLGDSTLRWLHARRLACLLAVMRRPWGVAKALALVTRGQFQQCIERTRMLVDVSVPIAEFRESLWHCRQREVARIARVDLLPEKRRRHAGIGLRPHGLRAGTGAVCRVLVGVEKHAVPFLLPPFARGQRRRAALDLACQREGGATHLIERPRLFDTH